MERRRHNSILGDDILSASVDVTTLIAEASAVQVDWSVDTNAHEAGA